MIEEREQKPRVVGWSGHCLPALLVENEVLWINPRIRTSLTLEVGEPCSYAFVLNINPKKVKSDTALEVWPNHGRTALLPGDYLVSDEKYTYRQVDIKGVGNITSDWKSAFVLPIKDNDPEECPQGIALRDYVEHDIAIAEELIEKGLRTCPTIALIKIHKIPYPHQNGETINVLEAINRYYLRPGREPVIQARAFITKARPEDIYVDYVALPYDYILSKIFPLYEEAKTLVALELGIEPKDFSAKNYLEWFASTMGQQIKIIHLSGYTHNYLIDHNFTLDCRIVDFDSATKTKARQKRHKDRLCARAVLRLLTQNVLQLESLKRRAEGYLSAPSASLIPHLPETEKLKASLVKIFYTAYCSLKKI